MIALPDHESSYWMSSSKRDSYEALAQDIEVDVAVVGGGIAGLTSAYLLKQSGLTVAVVEKNTIASGTTGGTTGKVTSQHNLIYADLQKRLGKEAAKLYGQANQTAIHRISEIISKEHIQNAWEIDDNYVFTAERAQIDMFKEEAKVASSLGLPASFETSIPLPFHIAGAVRFSGQGKINAPAYVAGLAKAVHGQGSFVFENSQVISFSDGSPASVRTRQATVKAKDIIVATKVPASPLLARGVYCALEYPHTSYIVAVKIPYDLKGMYISPDSGHYSLLSTSFSGDRLLLVGGQNHIPGLGNPKNRHQILADYAQKYFGASVVTYRWKAMDYLAYDKVPLIGKLYPWSEHLYVATAFKKWGLSTSMVAGMILHDLITGKANPWTVVFNSNRLRPVTSIPHEIISSLK